MALRYLSVLRPPHVRQKATTTWKRTLALSKRGLLDGMRQRSTDRSDFATNHGGANRNVWALVVFTREKEQTVSDRAASGALFALSHKAITYPV